jgi:hypothetical protein
MIRRARLWFWLTLSDVARLVRSHRAWVWCLCRAAAVEFAGRPEVSRDEDKGVPF